MIGQYFGCLLAMVTAFTGREDQFPYLSEDTWYFHADHRLSPEETFDHEAVHLGDTILIEDFGCRLFETLADFEKNYLPKISQPIILITARTDFSMPGEFGHLAESEKIAAWFTQNLSVPESDKLIALPIGIQARRWGNRDHRYFEKIKKRLSQNKWPRQHFLYVNMGMTTPKRRPILEYFDKMPFAHVIPPKRPFHLYLQDLCRSLFVVSPPGNGEDCHRTWESLIMGSYPIVESSNLDPLFADLPIVVIEDWETVTQEFLEEKVIEFQERDWNMEKIYAPFWLQRIEEIRSTIDPI